MLVNDKTQRTYDELTKVWSFLSQLLVVISCVSSGSDFFSQSSKSSHTFTNKKENSFVT
jgi:hypothetical protein